MNKLDDKVIVDRETLENLILYWVNSDVDSKVLSAAKQALAANLTGWVAVPVEPTDNMDVFATEDWLVQRALEDRASAIWQAMLEASPPLPGGGE